MCAQQSASSSPWGIVMEHILCDSLLLELGPSATKWREVYQAPILAKTKRSCILPRSRLWFHTRKISSSFQTPSSSPDACMLMRFGCWSTLGRGWWPRISFPNQSQRMRGMWKIIQSLYWSQHSVRLMKGVSEWRWMWKIFGLYEYDVASMRAVGVVGGFKHWSIYDHWCNGNVNVLTLLALIFVIIQCMGAIHCYLSTKYLLHYVVVTTIYC